MNIIKAWAPPMGIGWSEWISIYSHTGSRGLKVSFISGASSPFEIEILEGGRKLSKSYVGPIKNLRVVSRDASSKTKVRFKSHSSGQDVNINII